MHALIVRKCMHSNTRLSKITYGSKSLQSPRNDRVRAQGSAADLGEQVGLEAEQVALPVVGVQMVQVLVDEQPRRPLAQIRGRHAVPAPRSRSLRPLVALRDRAEVAPACSTAPSAPQVSQRPVNRQIDQPGNLLA